MRVAPSILLSDVERFQLESWSRGRSTPHRLVDRSKVLLLAAQGFQNKEIARILDVSEPFAARWRNRFHRLRLAGIEKDAPRPGRKPSIPVEKVDAIVDRTLHSKPRGATHWSTRSLADEMGVSHMTVQRVWKAHNLKPHVTRSFKLSKDKQFREKLVDVVGLYMNPPERAVVLSIDEKTQVQALERTQTILPLRPGVPEGRSHDYRRNGTVDLFASLNTIDGTVITQFHHRHRHQEFLMFLKTLDERVPERLEVHVVLDNHSAHKHERVRRWLVRHPRFHFHFTPTGSSWVNAVEGWFSRLTDKQIRRGSFKSVPALKKAIKEFVAAYSENPRPFVWTKPAEEILRKLEIIKQALVTAH